MSHRAHPTDQSLYALVAIVGIAASGLFAITMYNRHQVAQTVAQVSQVDSALQNTTISKAGVPPNFPENLPNATSTSNSVVVEVSSGKVQGLRRVTLVKNVSDTAKLYLSFFKQNGWAVITQTDTANGKLLAAVKGDTFIKINISKGSKDTNSSNVEIVVESN